MVLHSPYTHTSHGRARDASDARALDGSLRMRIDIAVTTPCFSYPGRCVRRALYCSILSLATFSACAEPPNKEMNLAQGAIEAARAAGADQYAPQEFAGAVEALRQSEQAVTQRDYRLALSRAIDSRERAQSAAKAAVVARAKARGDAERVIAVVTIQLTQARDRLKDPVVARMPRRVLDNAQSTLAAADNAMQEARAALASDDYAKALQRGNDASAQIQQATGTLDSSAGAAPQRRRR